MKQKEKYQLNTRPQMWPIGLTLAITLTLKFQGQIWNLLYLLTKLSDCHKLKMNASIEHKVSNVAISFDLGYDLDLGFSGSYL